jgi:hypothetical protein
MFDSFEAKQPWQICPGDRASHYLLPIFVKEKCSRGRLAQTVGKFLVFGHGLA